MCKENEYMCKSGKNCIPLDYICDGVTDCEDNDDEEQCNRKRELMGFTAYGLDKSTWVWLGRIEPVRVGFPTVWS